VSTMHDNGAASALAGRRRPTRPARPAKVILSAGLGLLALLQATPAGAAEPSPGLRWKSGGERTSDNRLSGTVHLRADVSSDHPVDGWAITVVTPSGAPVFGVVCRDTFPRAQTSFSLDCAWETTHYSDQRPSANGHYLVRLTTQDANGAQPAGPDRPVAVTNQAAAPSDATVNYDDAGRQATVTWTPNPEPDVIRYDIEERQGNGPWTRVAATVKPQWQTAVTEPGDRSFRVAAERRNADGATGGPGAWAPVTPSRPTASPGGNGPRSAGPADADRRPASRASESPTSHRDSTGTSSADADRRPASRGGRNRRPAGVRPDGTPASGGQWQASPAPAPAPPPATPETAPQTRAAMTGAAPADDTPPPDHASLGFSSSPADPFSSLHDPPRAGAAAPATVTKPVSASAAGQPALTPPESDSGFETALPYPATEDRAGAFRPTEAAAPGPRAAAPAPRRAATGRRLIGLLLFTVGAGLLATVLRPTRRSRRRRVAAAAPAAAPVPTAVVPTGPTGAAPAAAPMHLPAAEEPAWLTRLESCIARLEAHLPASPAAATPGGTSPAPD